MSSPGPSHSNDGQPEEHLREAMLNLHPPPPPPPHHSLSDEYEHQLASSSSSSFYDQIPAAAAEAVAAARAAAADEEHANDHHLLHHPQEGDGSSSSSILDTVTAAAAAAAAAAAQQVTVLPDPPIGSASSSSVYDTVTAAAAVAAATAADHATNGGTHYLGRIESLEGLTEGIIKDANGHDDESHDQSGAATGEKRHKQKRRTIRKACDICHVAKVKCILPYPLEQPIADENGEVHTNSGPVHRPQAPCERCQKLSKDCTFTPVVKRKGRKRKIEDLYGPGSLPTSAADVAAAAASSTAAGSASIQTGYSDASVQTNLDVDEATRAAADLNGYQIPLESRTILPPPAAPQPEHTSDDALTSEHDANAAAAAAVAAAAASAANNASESDQVLEWFTPEVDAPHPPSKLMRSSISHSHSHSPLPPSSQNTFQPLYLDSHGDEQTS